MKRTRSMLVSVTMLIFATSFVLWSQASASGDFRDGSPKPSIVAAESAVASSSEDQTCTPDSDKFCGFVPIKGPVCGKSGRGPYSKKAECESEEGKTCKALCATACPAC